MIESLKSSRIAEGAEVASRCSTLMTPLPFGAVCGSVGAR